MNNERDILFRKYLDGDLTKEEEQKVLHRFADDEELRTMLRFELKLQQSFREEPDLSSFEVPEGFTDNVMNAIASSSNAEAGEDATETNPTPGLLDWLWTPRPIQWRPVYAMVFILLLAVMLIVPGTPTINQDSGVQGISESTTGESVQTVSQSNDKVWLRFVFIDEEASSVAVAGDFSNWEPVQLTKQEVNGKPVWTGLVSMTRGEHRYMFVKDGEEWVTDPLAPMHREDGFGNKNAIIYL